MTVTENIQVTNVSCLLGEVGFSSARSGVCGNLLMGMSGTKRYESAHSDGHVGPCSSRAMQK